MTKEIIIGLLLPFLGTALGAGCVFLLGRALNETLHRCFAGFAAGVMVAASIWSLILPSMEQSNSMGKWAFLPAVIGFWIGIFFLFLLDRLIPHLHVGVNAKEGLPSHLKRTTMMMLAVTLHNVPEGMAVGVILAGYQAGNAYISLAQAFAFSFGIALQNFPEGAIISLPLRSEGFSKRRAFFYGVLSGAVEPVAGIFTLLATVLVLPALPYFLAFAAGAMFYVVVDELIPEMAKGKHSNVGVMAFSVGFSLMMVLDVALG